MSSRTYAQLQDVLLDQDFPALDLALRRGRHVDRDDASWYDLLIDAQEHLEQLYRRYGCELVYKSDGYFFLLPTGEQLPRRQLAPGDMLVGQALALLYLDPSSVERGGLVTREQVIEQLVGVVGTDSLIAAFLPKRKRQDEQVTQRQVRAKIGEALRRLSNLGFAESQPGDQLRLRPALLRFAEPVRGLVEPAAALARLISQGEVALTDPDGAAAPDAEEDEDAAGASEDASAALEVGDDAREQERALDLRDAEGR